ncbi:hypothetical protein GH714_021070 [Hevea brasiliensis]|uniref:Uncharacterized protein n=1 Tax=Hevea brasiliensis TaxID=3981 RepID=A0A6A6MFK9_HEVBR|nr:hypothetical protein GH714_021070 [Hevea brasiliensis]
MKELSWSFPGVPEVQKLIFAHFIRNLVEHIKISDWLLANSFYELEPLACDFIPDALPIGPLFASNHLGPFPGNFWPEGSICLSWLDEQPAAQSSMLHLAARQSATQQFNELAHGLEILGKPFYGFNSTYICETWKVGLKLIPDENGIVTRHEKGKVEKLLSDTDIKANSLKLKEMAGNSISEGGSSSKNFLSFIEQIKQ